MKKNIEKIEKTIVEEKVTWVAMDGTVFRDEEACEKWESSFECTISNTFNEMQKYITDSCELGLAYSSEDHTSFVIVPKNENEIIALNYIIKNCDSYGLEDLTLNYIGKKIIFNFGYADENCPAFRNEFLEVRDFDKVYEKLKNTYEKIISTLDGKEEK